MKKVTLFLRVDPEVKNILKEIKKDTGLSYSFIISWILNAEWIEFKRGGSIIGKH